jgi:UDP-2,4-diacetamido-2,4,6-trideoxy-beta-L-altropyranose hydrolase
MVAIRTDASQLIGSGHVMRCRTLAGELRRRGADVLLICREHPGNMIQLLRDDGYAVAVLPAVPDYLSQKHRSGYAGWLGVSQQTDAGQTLAVLQSFPTDWLVVDHYGLDNEWESVLRSQAKSILAIDDLSRAHDCDALLDQNWFGAQTRQRYAGRVDEHCRQFLGPRYALLQPAFAQLRKGMPVREGGLRRVLIFFGGVDSRNLTTQALLALKAPSLCDLEVDVVVGSANPHLRDIERLVASRPGSVLHRGLPHLADLMAQADLMLGAGGTTTWERCCLGLPAIVVSAAENQRGFTDWLTNAGVQFGLGNADRVTAGDWQAMIEGLRAHPQRLAESAGKAMDVTDGCGVLRIASMMEQRPPTVKIRRAAPTDEAWLLDWANDPLVRDNAFSKETIDRQTHRGWFGRKLADPGCLILIGEDQHGLPVGQVRFDCRDGEGVIDISIDAALRELGVGKTLLQLAITQLRQTTLCKTVVADVLADNEASRKLFLGLGFRPAPPDLSKHGSLRFVLPMNG